MRTRLTVTGARDFTLKNVSQAPRPSMAGSIAFTRSFLFSIVADMNGCRWTLSDVLTVSSDQPWHQLPKTRISRRTVGVKADRLLREITPTDIRSWRDALKRQGLAAQPEG